MVHPVYQSPFLSMSLRSPVTQQEHGDASRGRRQRGVHGHLCRQGAVAAGLHGQRGARVEAVPAEPEKLDEWTDSIMEGYRPKMRNDNQEQGANQRNLEDIPK